MSPNIQCILKYYFVLWLFTHYLNYLGVPPTSVPNGLPVQHDYDSSINYTQYGHGSKDLITLDCPSNKFQLLRITTGENKGDSLGNHCQWNQQGFKYPADLIEDLSCQSKYLLKLNYCS